MRGRFPRFAARDLDIPALFAAMSTAPGIVPSLQAFSNDSSRDSMLKTVYFLYMLSKFEVQE